MHRDAYHSDARVCARARTRTQEDTRSRRWYRHARLIFVHSAKPTDSAATPATWDTLIHTLIRGIVQGFSFDRQRVFFTPRVFFLLGNSLRLRRLAIFEFRLSMSWSASTRLNTSAPWENERRCGTLSTSWAPRYDKYRGWRSTCE